MKSPLVVKNVRVVGFFFLFFRQKDGNIIEDSEKEQQKRMKSSKLNHFLRLLTHYKHNNTRFSGLCH